MVTHDVLFVMKLATRKVACAGITPYPGAAWMLQIGRNLTDTFSGFLRGKSFLIMDRDSSVHEAFRDLLNQAGIRSVRIPPRAPNCNAHLERFHGSYKREVADRMIFFGQRHLQGAGRVQESGDGLAETIGARRCVGRGRLLGRQLRRNTAGRPEAGRVRAART